MAENWIVPTIQIRLNGEMRKLPAERTLASLLELFDLPSQRIAIELNGTVISRKFWPEITVNDGDRIEVVHFVGGG